MKNKKYLILILTVILGVFNSCDVLEPEDENIFSIEDVRNTVTFVEGLLINAYRKVPASHDNFTLAYASDDAVNNDPGSGVKAVVQGGWTSVANPFSVWNSSYESIFYIHSFLEEMEGIDWFPRNETTSALFDEKLRGEAYALRAWNYFHLLQAHAGRGKNGQLLGVPIVDRVLENSPEYEIPRATFNETIKFIIDDCDRAIEALPGRWLPTGDADADQAIGERNTNRINGHVARLIKTKALLYAASPAYSDGTYTYQMAAEAAVGLMDDNNGISSSDFGRTKTKFYNEAVVPGTNNVHADVMWYSFRQTGENGWERTNFPPSQFGRGLTNPTQELVNAFPLVDGTPTPADKINSNDPYSGRDPRLSEYIMYQGSQYRNEPLNTVVGSQDALGSQNLDATKTGYYLKKFMNVKVVNLAPGINSSGIRYYTYARYTDALLMFAEAANEVGGPDAIIGGYSARAVINAIRDRAGITSTAYVNGLSTAEMTNLIRNERRLELCFEKQRFWDIRRWNLTSLMKNPVSGVIVTNNGGELDYEYIEVEGRNFSDFQIYGPIPFNETLKYDIVQNQGWQ
ncbi:hypothetical protein BST83_11560 [Polaribacter filamentus]|jgi:hypothetical protein|uniref:RagB/SusD family nutrient uptake outer membrane protein n=1 Tax=Polaribacter filamentus TaxID=53483 RepID=A0A2S7KYH6_9FLAO|nr:RagB/SusD family nutrient uptake outer membrane protein [Polaribacter filamentus]PQB07722.1 hypothetical protein BST83_11560 [Polaribacter filamentus]